MAVSLREKSRLIEGITLRDIGRRGVDRLYRAVSDLAAGTPTLSAADSLYRATKRGGNVIVTSGFTILTSDRCETDGPLGSIVLGKLIGKMGAHLILLTDPDYLDLFEAICISAGLTSFQCLGFPIEHDQAKVETTKIFDEFSPVAIIAIERPGWNRKFVYHNMLGQDISSKTAKVDYIFNHAQLSRTLTIGIGDGGNEIGMGNIAGTINEHVPFGSVCRCPCRGGIASITKVDHLIVSSVSNWGGYGLAAILARLANVPFEHTPNDERRLIKAAVKAGAVDGVTGKSIPAVDGVDMDGNAEVVRRILMVMYGHGSW